MGPSCETKQTKYKNAAKINFSALHQARKEMDKAAADHTNNKQKTNLLLIKTQTLTQY